MYVCIDLYGPINRLSIRDSNDHFVHQIQSENCIFKYGSGWGYSSFIDIDYLKNNQVRLLPGGTLTICLEVIKPGPQSSVSCLAKDLEDIMNDREFADCEIQTSEGTIKCHKGVAYLIRPYLIRPYLIRPYLIRPYL